MLFLSFYNILLSHFLNFIINFQDEFERRRKARELANGGAARKVRPRGDVVVLDKDSKRVESLTIVVSFFLQKIFGKGILLDITKSIPISVISGIMFDETNTEASKSIRSPRSWIFLAQCSSMLEFRMHFIRICAFM